MGKKLSVAQRRELEGIVNPKPDDDPFPPMNVVRALMRKGLVIAVEPDDSDIGALLAGMLELRATDAGRRALEEDDG